MSRDEEFVSKKITIESLFPYGSQLSDTIFISVNGLLSVGRENSSFTPTRMPVGNQSLLAVYWADLDLLTGDETAEIFYQLYKKENATSDKSKEIFRAANAEVVKHSNDKKTYDALSVLVVTWVEVPADSSSDERVSFQCVVITDGETTYAMYIYSNGKMNFDPRTARSVEVGWGSINLDPKRSSYYTFDQILGNTGATGRWFFKIGERENFKVKCLNWYRTNQNDLQELSKRNAAIPPCPCNEFAAFASGLWLRSLERERCYDVIPIYGDYGRRCCYRLDGSFNFENRRPLAGSLQRYNAFGRQLGNHVINDIIPKKWCCDQSDLCDLYYTVRPTRSCVPTEWARALLFGDPHVITLDQEAYIFNGEGVYRILEINTSEVNFRMQGRTCRAVGSSGNLTDATIWCALAMMSTNNDTMRVSMNDNGTRMIIYANDQDYSVRYYSEQQFNATVNGMTLRRIDDSLQISSPDSVAVNVTLTNKLLEFSVVLDTKYKTKTKGLLGNFNDNKNDDYQFPDGRKPLSPNATEREKFSFGKAWAVTDAAASLFKFEYGQNLTAGADFVPEFLEEVNATLRAEAEKVCDSNNIPCVYDYIATRNSELAKTSAVSAINQKNITDIISNNAPVLTGVTNNEVTINGTFNVTLDAYDPDGENVSVVFLAGSHENLARSYNDLVCEVMLNKLECQFQLRTTEIISIAVIDTRKLQSEIVKIPVVACNSCSRRGQCNFNATRKTTESSYDLATCVCDKGYSGLDCEQDKDGCAFQPCPVGTGCLDSPAEKEASTGLAYSCTNCPSGFLLNGNKTKCEDINECYNTSSPVCGGNGDCINTIGGYTCSCHEGFRLNRKLHCVDIDECVENTHRCNQICGNTVGAYSCKCEPGFETFNDKFTCLKLNDTRDPCAKLNKTCEYGCRNTTSECFCQRGKKLKQDGQSCEDINECETSSVCSQNCINTDGNFLCTCYNGYKLNVDQTTCDTCSGNNYGRNCSMTCVCLGRAIRCDNVKGCICQSGWRGINCEQDVDECAVAGTCRVDQICINTNGSFMCICPDGYTELNGTCSNVNECLDPSQNSCTQRENCRDVPGTYICVCREGYFSANNSCQDIDECSSDISGCSHLCVNTDGSYNCECFPGYTLEDDRKTCRKKLDLCESSYLNCSFGCTIQNETAQCICATGYQLSTNNQDCLDINECTTRKHLCTGICINTVGSYNCSCNEGEKLQNDQRSCIECDSFHWGHECVNECKCSPSGSSQCSRTKGCVCRPGWAGLTCSNDIDECSATDPPCPSLSSCINTPGSYHCQCRVGYQLTKETLMNQTCVDIDECSNGSPCDVNCTNTMGSYSCSCPSGFRVEENKCTDIDECAVTQLNNCDQNCRNTNGKFACECNDGYVRNTSSNACDLIDLSLTCKTSNPCNQTCTAEGNSIVCSCQPGYILAQDGKNCNDDNECQSNPCIRGHCVNYDGGFSCSCDDGFHLSEDKLTCAECKPGYFGSNCSNECTCNSTNVESCNRTDGRCTCSQGWKGTNCSEDVNECSNTTLCLSNSYCLNSPGSYRCVCNIGFYRSGKMCLGCDANRYGQDCSQNCSCVQANTEDCNNTDGNCTCKEGWTGSHCQLDIDECQNTSFCKGPHENCNNLNGSVECGCGSGYERNQQDSTCRDINECLNPSLNNCESPKECNNTDGSKVCVCQPGYLATFNDICEENFKEFPLKVEFEYPNVTDDLLNTQTRVFRNLALKIEASLLDFGNKTIGRACLSIRITHFTRGSLIANTAVRIDQSYSSNPFYDAALLAKNLQTEKSLLIGNEPFNVTDVFLNNISVSLSDDVCQLYNQYKEQCTAAEKCSKDGFNTTVCRTPVPEDDLRLIIGLAVGIPLFLIAVVIVIIVVWCYVRQKKSVQQDHSSVHSSENTPFAQLYTGQIAPKRTFSIPALYSPDTYSETSDSVDSRDDKMGKSAGSGLPQSASAWVAAPAQSRQYPMTRSVEDLERNTSSFSWAQMAKLLDRFKNFEIKRPALRPNPVPMSTSMPPDTFPSTSRTLSPITSHQDRGVSSPEVLPQSVSLSSHQPTDAMSPDVFPQTEGLWPLERSPQRTRMRSPDVTDQPTSRKPTDVDVRH
ncbi:unnamed protein product [Lymnaea stagnalis]|uniref:Mucin-like protein n=1 Tax=Lymnaea stagnalis TaxID=6523 RepID=A0AAV2ILC1_LYMST